MAGCVLKFGGSSLASTELIRQGATLVKKHWSQSSPVAVVVSAMGNQTDQLVALAKDLGASDGPAYDTIIAAGEQISTGAMALALQELGLKATPLQGWQLPIITSENPSKARIQSIAVETLKSLMDQGIIPVIAGFQGITPQGMITTFGRGGSDLTAVAVAAALKVDQCILYKDVPGVLNADPRIIEGAQLQEQITYDEMIELSGLGSKVIQSRAVEMAAIQGVPLQVLPTNQKGPGSAIGDSFQLNEKENIRGVVVNGQETKITLVHAPISIAIKAQLFDCLAKSSIPIDMIIQHGPGDGDQFDDLSFTVCSSDAKKAMDLCESLKEKLGFKKVVSQDRVAKISLVGSGMRGHTGVAQTLFRVLADLGITTYGVSTSELKLSVLVGAHYAPQAAKALHQAFGLDQLKTNKDQNCDVA